MEPIQIETKNINQVISSLVAIAVGILILALILGLLFRKKGDGFLDTIQSGCWILVVFGLLFLGYLIYNGSF